MTRLAHKYPKNEVRNMLFALMRIGEMLQGGRNHSVDPEYVFSRTGYSSIYRNLFDDCLEFLIEAEFFRRMPRDDQVYVLN